MRNFEHLTGLIVPPFTPMAADGRLDLGRIDGLAEAFGRAGLRGVFVCGTTGECLSLTVSERMQVAECWQSAAGDKLTVIVHVGHNCLAECKALAGHAAKIGAHAVAAFGPSYFRPRCAEDLTAFCAEVASAAGKLPFYYYHIPSMTGVDLPLYDFLQAAGKQIPNLAGAKYADNDLADFVRCLRMDRGRFDVLFGSEEILLSALVLGGRGAVGMSYNFAAPLYLRILEAFDAGRVDAAQQDQHRAAQLAEVLNRFGHLPAEKAIMKMIGLDCGPVRLPLRDLSEKQCGEMRRELEKIGFFDYCLQV